MFVVMSPLSDIPAWRRSRSRKCNLLLAVDCAQRDPGDFPPAELELLNSNSIQLWNSLCVAGHEGLNGGIQIIPLPDLLLVVELLKDFLSLWNVSWWSNWPALHILTVFTTGSPQWRDVGLKWLIEGSLFKGREEWDQLIEWRNESLISTLCTRWWADARLETKPCNIDRTALSALSSTPLYDALITGECISPWWIISKYWPPPLAILGWRKLSRNNASNNQNWDHPVDPTGPAATTSLPSPVR